MNAVEIEQAIFELAEQTYDSLEFPFQFLVAFGNKETTIQKLRKGNSNKSDILNGILQRNHIHIATCETGKVARTLNTLKSSPANVKGKVKFILATDGDELQAEDLILGETIACDYDNFANHFGFFLPLAGISTVKEIRDNPIDIQATSRLNRLYVELLSINEDWATTERRHDMNQFMGRLIFCYFAEDTNIFNGNDLFTKTVEQISDSKTDNTDFVLKELFRAMDTPYNERASSNIPRWADAMPYVNGGLFAGTRDVPKFTRAARSYLLHAGNLNWKEINPDIFGSMIQAVADDEERGYLGMHYTSVPNILRVLNPLFLDGLRKQFDECGDNLRKLLNLKKRMTRIRVFDPACGSGNFLVIAYKEIRKIEFKINKLRGETNLKSEIPLNNFRGIELREFPAEIARLALIIAEFQCDVFYRGQKDALRDFLPLDSKNWIVCGNALQLDWLSVCPPTGIALKHAAEDLFHMPLDQREIDFENEGGETFICGNPPYKGSKLQSDEQKLEMSKLCNGIIQNYKSLDYVSMWFIKASNYINYEQRGSFSFVTTNSICQGQSVSILWPYIKNKKQRIIFATNSFLWKNLASKNAGVVVTIVGVSQSDGNKAIFYSFSNNAKTIIRTVDKLNAYLIPGPDVYVTKETLSISGLTKMESGSKMTDGSNLVFNQKIVKETIKNHPISKKFFKNIVGGDDLISGLKRWCIWVEDEDYETANKIPVFKKRFLLVRDMRNKSSKRSTQELAEKPHRFDEKRYYRKRFFAVPQTSSIQREYLPCDYFDENTILIAPHLFVTTNNHWVFSIICSKLHIVWIGCVCGKLKTDFRYSNSLGWNTFPLPKLTEKNKEDLTRCAENILLARESHFPETIADLYGLDKMPDNLRAAHDRNDEVLERIYIGRRFKNDTERLEKLFDLYTKMTSAPTLNERVL